MDHALLRTPSVGSLTKKILAVNPSLGIPEIIGIVRQSLEVRPADGMEVINEVAALELARLSLIPGLRRQT